MMTINHDDNNDNDDGGDDSDDDDDDDYDDDDDDDDDDMMIHDDTGRSNMFREAGSSVALCWFTGSHSPFGHSWSWVVV